MKLKLLITSCAFVFLYVGNVDAGIKKLKARVSGGDDRQQVQVQPLPPQPAPLEADHHPRGEALPHDVEGGDLPPLQDGGIPQAPPLGGGDEEHLALPLVQPQPLAELLRDNIMVNHYLHPEAPAEDAGEVHNEDFGGGEEEGQEEEQEERNAELPHGVQDPLHVPDAPADEPPAEAAPVQAQPQQDNPLLAGPAVAPPPAGNQQQPGQPGAGGDVPPPLAEGAGEEEVHDDVADPNAQPDAHAPRQPRRGGGRRRRR